MYERVKDIVPKHVDLESHYSQKKRKSLANQYKTKTSVTKSMDSD